MYYDRTLTNDVGIVLSQAAVNCRSTLWISTSISNGLAIKSSGLPFCFKLLVMAWLADNKYHRNVMCLCI
jgi:hypothetical protein